jgi:hypothetical protein
MAYRYQDKRRHNHCAQDEKLPLKSRRRMNIDEETLSQLKRELPMAYVPNVDLLTIDTMDISSFFYALGETLPASYGSSVQKYCAEPHNKYREAKTVQF